MVLMRAAVFQLAVGDSKFPPDTYGLQRVLSATAGTILESSVYKSLACSGTNNI